MNAFRTRWTVLRADVFGNHDLLTVILWTTTRGGGAGGPLASSKVESALALACTCTTVSALLGAALARGPRLLGWVSPALMVQGVQRLQLDCLLTALLKRVPMVATLIIHEDLDLRAALALSAALRQRVQLCRMQRLHLHYRRASLPHSDVNVLGWLVSAVPKLRHLELSVSGARLDRTITALNARHQVCQLEALSLSGVRSCDLISCLHVVAALLTFGVPNLSSLQLEMSAGGSDVAFFGAPRVVYPTERARASVAITCWIILERNLTWADGEIFETAHGLVQQARSNSVKTYKVELVCDGASFSMLSLLIDNITKEAARGLSLFGHHDLEVIAQGTLEHEVGWFEDWEWSNRSSGTPLSETPFENFPEVERVLVRHISSKDS